MPPVTQCSELRVQITATVSSCPGSMLQPICFNYEFDRWPIACLLIAKRSQNEEIKWIVQLELRIYLLKK